MDPSKAYVLYRKPMNEDYVRLQIEETRSPPQKIEYLEREILRKKLKTNLSVDNYISRTRNHNKGIQFYKKSSRGNITYTTGPYFTLGLQKVGERSELKIRNLAEYIPIYPFVCRPDRAHLYSKDVEDQNALVNKNSIVEDFLKYRIEPKKNFSLSPNSVYFVYMVTHSKFSVKSREISSPARDVLRDESTSSGRSAQRSTRQLRSSAQSGKTRQVTVDAVSESTDTLNTSTPSLTTTFDHLERVMEGLNTASQREHHELQDTIMDNVIREIQLFEGFIDQIITAHDPEWTCCA